MKQEEIEVGREQNTGHEKTSKKVTDHLANERTFLAWVRTGLATITFGFVVERFSLLLRELGLKSNLALWTAGLNILDALKGVEGGMSQVQLVKDLDGKKQTNLAAIRKMVDLKILKRSGAGLKSDPFWLRLLATTEDPLAAWQRALRETPSAAFGSDSVPEKAEIREPQITTPENAVPVVPGAIDTTGKCNVTLSTACRNAVPVVPAFPETVFEREPNPLEPISEASFDPKPGTFAWHQAREMEARQSAQA